MTYDELYQNAGDYTGVYTNLVLEKDITWNVVGVLANLMKCDKIGVKPTQKTLAMHCNVSRSTVELAITVLREKKIISEKKGFAINYDVLYNLVLINNERSKEITKNSKMTENRSKSDEGVSEINTPNDRKSVNEMTENRLHNKYNNKNNKPKNFICNNQESCNTEVKQNITNKKKKYIVPKVLKVFPEFDKNSFSVFSSFSSVEGEGTEVNNTPSAERLNSLRSRVEVAKKELLDEFEKIIQGADYTTATAAKDACYYKWEEYRERIVKAAINPKRLEEEYQMLSDYFRETQALHDKYEDLTAGLYHYGYCGSHNTVNTNLALEIENRKRASA